MMRLFLTALLVAALAGCDTSNFAFRTDKSISITVPKAQADVSLPVMVKWTDSKPPAGMKVDPRPSGADYYAVFLDVAPMSPGKRLSSLVENPDRCKVTAGCPTLAQLETVGVHLTAKPEALLEFVADLSRPGGRDPHEVTIIRMRGNRRAGETAYRQTFFVRR